MLADLVAGQAFILMLVFARVGSALMILPGIGDTYVPARLRLALALAVSLVLAAAIGHSLAPMPGEPAALVLLVAGEVIAGLLVGVAARVMFAALHIAGSAIAMQSGLAAAAVFDPSEATQGSLPGRFLTVIAIVLLFATDAHHGLLRAIAASYAGMVPGEALPLGDLAGLLVRFLSEAFAVAVRIAAPVLVVGLLVYAGMAILNRLMPAFQVFFVAMPLQILLAFAVLMLSLSGGLLAFFAMLETGLDQLAVGG